MVVPKTLDSRQNLQIPKKGLKKRPLASFKGQNVHCALVLSPQPRLASRFFAAAANSGGGAGGGCKALWRQPLHSVLKWVFSGHLYIFFKFQLELK